MIESTGSSSHQTSELVAYHRQKRIFLSLANNEQEDPDQIQIRLKRSLNERRAPCLGRLMVLEGPLSFIFTQVCK